MNKIKVTFKPDDIVVYGKPGDTISDVAKISGLNIYMPCGGNGICGKCKVIVKNLSHPLNKKEKNVLSEEEINKGVRLACQSLIENDMEVQLLMKNDSELAQILSTNLGLKGVEINSYVKRKDFTLSLKNDNQDIGYVIQLIENEPDFKNLSINLKALQDISNLYDPNVKELNLTAIYTKEKIISITKQNKRNQYGVGVDIGTTSIVAYLINIETGEQVGISSRLNPQVEYGDDVITRINYISQNKEGLNQLQSLVINGLNEQITELCNDANIIKDDIYQVSIAANTVMQHIFLGVNPKSIGVSPYIPTYRQTDKIKASDIGIHINKVGLITALPNLSGYIGSDVIAGAYIADIAKSEKLKVIIDIGTNSEIIMGNKDFLLACSSAAGPALEGARISYGMRGTSGAIEQISYDNQFNMKVIGNVEAEGICGSGLVDIASEMLRLKVIEPSGKLTPSANIEELDLKERMFKIGKMNAFKITNKDSESSISMSQKDIRELQLAKGAILGGLNILLKHAEKEIDEIDKVYVAGAFGNYINKKSAVNIGLFPGIELEKIQLIGNTAGMGASMSVLTENVVDEMNALSKSIKYIELTTCEYFQEEFLKALSFPDKLKYSNIYER